MGAGWMGRAACLTTDPEAFFPAPGDHVTARLAVRICGGCAVRAECLADALARGETREGIRGGMTPRERRAAARELAGARHQGAAAESLRAAA